MVDDEAGNHVVAERFCIDRSKKKDRASSRQTEKPHRLDAMNTNIYHTTKRPRLHSAVKEAAEWSEFTYKDDPDYNAFCISVRKEVEREGIQRFVKGGVELDSVRTNKLYGVWYTSATFRAHWKQPQKQSHNAMLWILYNRGWSEAQGYVSIVAWWRMHHRKVTPAMLEELERLAERCGMRFKKRR